jgi:hypothetical protein
MAVATVHSVMNVGSVPEHRLVGSRFCVYLPSHCWLRSGVVTTRHNTMCPRTHQVGVEFIVLFDDGDTVTYHSTELHPGEYWVDHRGRESLVPATPSDLCHDVFRSGATFRPCVDFRFGDEGVEIGLPVEVFWPLHGVVVRGVIGEVETTAAGFHYVVLFEDGTTRRCAILIIGSSLWMTS